ncbi:MAG: aminopeptidase [Blautia sp.]|uniref:aminopeptidase n=1 Tax=Blautia sp. TaxID=1955243 RepID=UPI002E77B8F4|nr:aminopeptidase [Blautia sp.]MEE1442485.1 aminopeptidase [Blautia sp.]
MNDELMLERFMLMKERVLEIQEEELVKDPYRDFFRRTAAFITQMLQVYDKLQAGWLDTASLEELEANNQAMYQDILPQNYEKSYGNPSYAQAMLGEEMGQLLSFLYTEIRGMIVFVYENRLFDMTVAMELFIQIYNLFEEETVSAKDVQDAIYWYVSDYSDEMVGHRVREGVDPELNFATNIICGNNLADVRYLYKFGEYVTENEIRMAKFLSDMPQEKLESMARTYTEGYRRGFLAANIDLSKKKTVNIRFQLGFEPMVKAAISQFAKMGLAPVMYRSAVHTVNKRQHMRIGYYGAVPNPQFDYDHKDDQALYLDHEFVQRKLRVLQVAYEQVKTLAGEQAGPAVIETFGETPFAPVKNPKACALSPHQQKLQVSYDNESGQIVNRYIKGDERSFTIIAYPVAEIGPKFEEIFQETVKINTLDNEQYQKIQQSVIDALDQGVRVHIEGMNGNDTNLTVCLQELKNPEKETNFENCVADVNIPVGEVFTSPKLTGTNGILAVSKVFLRGLEYRNLHIRFQDGMIADYICSNFESQEDSKNFIKENLLYHHDTLPLGEFAIGTNTTAYVMAKKYNIGHLLPILIAEKTGPHFAVGDTCYSWSEDTATFNPDGKEITAKDNEVSILRKEDLSKAYFGCHTDITIPYDELGAIWVETRDGERISIIENGKFVLKGTEALNEAFTS